MTTVIYNIANLCGILPVGGGPLSGEDMNKVECIQDAYLVLRDGLIADFGPNGSHPFMPEIEAGRYFDAEGGMVLPAFCDSHTHVVYELRTDCPPWRRNSELCRPFAQDQRR